MKRLFFPILLGVVGCTVLVGLGIWQVQRMEWKAAVLAAIDARIGAALVALPAAPDPVTDAFLPVTVTGALGGREVRVLTADADLGGAGYRVISVLTTGDRQVLVDLGYVPLADQDQSRMAASLTVTGNLHWPDEVDGWTPAPDGALWFARDVPAIATALGAEPFLIVAREVSPALPGMTLLPIDSRAIPNNHRVYAITWFSLAAVWAAMSLALIWRSAGKGLT